MSTRRAPEGSPTSQERYASSPVLEKGLNAVLVKNRCATLGDARVIELVWFIQYQSLQQGGLDKFMRDLLATFPERLGTPAMLKIAAKPGDTYNADQVRAVRDEDKWRGIFDSQDFPLRGETMDDLGAAWLVESDRSRDRQEARKHPVSYPVAQFIDLCRASFVKVVPDILTRFCLDPAFESEQINAAVTDERGISSQPFFRDLIGALLEYMERWERDRLAHLVKTTVGKGVLDALDYAEAERALVLIEGIYGTGKTHVARAWCEAKPGKRRYVQCPSSNDGIDFFRTMAEPIGVSNAHSMKASQMRARVNDVLQAGYLSVVIDEAHYCFPQASMRVALPARINWVMTALSNYSVPVALVATPQFTAAQATVEKNTFWASGQFIGRISRFVKLPESLEETDLHAIARAHLPDGDEKSIAALVLYARASKKRLRGIEHGIKAARHVARCAGRERVTFADIKQAMHDNLMPSDSALNEALSNAASPASSGVKKRGGKSYAVPSQALFQSISSPRPERESGEPLVTTSGRARRSPQASLSSD